MSKLTEKERAEDHYDFSQDCENVFGRIYTISSREEERYYLRMLLLCLTGYTSFASIWTVDGKVYPACCEACLRRGLLSEDAECKLCFRDAFELPFQELTELFTMILAH